MAAGSKQIPPEDTLANLPLTLTALSGEFPTAQASHLLSIGKHSPNNKHILLINSHCFLLPSDWSLVTNTSTYYHWGPYVFNINLQSLANWVTQKKKKNS